MGPIMVVQKSYKGWKT